MTRKNGWEPYRRDEDNLLGWRVWSQGNIIATDGGQGYANWEDMTDACESAADWIINTARSGGLDEDEAI